MSQDWNESILPIHEIRTHTKTNDIKTVEDSQLALYRAAAFEQVEYYTGIIIAPVRTVYQSVIIGTKAIDLDYRARDTVYWSIGNSSGAVSVKPLERRVKIPNLTANIFCGVHGDRFNLQYETGFSCRAEVPANILIGCLKLIAWDVRNAGDQLVTMRVGAKSNLSSASASGIGGTNDGVLASGAQERWAKYAMAAF